MDAFDLIIEEIAKPETATRSRAIDRAIPTYPAPGSIIPPVKAGRKATLLVKPAYGLPSAPIPSRDGASETTGITQPIATLSRSRKSARKSGEIGHPKGVSQTPPADLNLSASDGGDAGRAQRASHGSPAGVEASAQADGGGQSFNDTHSKVAPATPMPERADDAGQDIHDTQSDSAGVVNQIVQLWRMRQRWHRAEKSLILQGKALCRAWCDGDKTKASEMFDAAANGKDCPMEVAIALMPFLSSIERFKPERTKLEKELQKLAKSLPVWSWVSIQRGFGALNLAALVGEAGDIGSYRNPSCLWKRMGLAVIEGGRQRRVTDAEAALVHGYNPSRRAVAYLIGDCLIKGNGDGMYRTLYLARKEIEAAKDEIKTKAHAHNRAARYMTKRVLRNLWSAWRVS